MKNDDQRWKQLAGALRDAGAVDRPGNDQAPHGFATRVLAIHRENVRSSERADRIGLVLWRRWALGAAVLSCVGCGLLFLNLPEPEPQFLPLPALDISLQTP